MKRRNFLRVTSIAALVAYTGTTNLVASEPTDLVYEIFSDSTKKNGLIYHDNMETAFYDDLETFRTYSNSSVIVTREDFIKEYSELESVEYIKKDFKRSDDFDKNSIIDVKGKNVL